MWKVLIFASLLGAVSLIVLVLDSGVIGGDGDAELTRSATEAYVRVSCGAGLNAARVTGAARRSEERRDAILISSSCAGKVRV